MYFSIVIILLIGIVGYLHYVQGLFSALISATCAALASVLAMSYYEPATALILRGKMADSSYAAMLVVLMVVIYAVLRTLFDNLVPGNVRLPSTLDRIGGAIFGLVAGLFGIGTLAIAAQLLPFGPSIGGYSRFAMTDARDVKLPTHGQSQDTSVNDEVKTDKMPAAPPEDPQTMIVPADDFVVAAVGMLSKGSLEGDRSFDSIHPQLLNEAFYDRLGMQVGAKRVAFNTEKLPQVALVGMYSIPGVSQVSAEIPEIRPSDVKPSVLLSDVKGQLIVARIRFTQNASDSDHIVRVSTGAIRIVANGEDFYPYGTLENGVLAVNRIDDFILIDAEKDADFVFKLPFDKAGTPGVIISKDAAAVSASAPMRLAGPRGSGADAANGTSTPATGPKFREGAFLEVKQQARFDLSAQPILTTLPDVSKGVLRKDGLKFVADPKAPMLKIGNASAAAAEPSAAPAAPAEAPADSPFQFASIKTSADLGFKINVGQHDGDSADVKFNSGTATLKDKLIAKLDVRPVDTFTDLQKGDYPAGELSLPAGMKLVQIAGTIPAAANDNWTWATGLANFEVVDAAGTKIKPSGAFAKVTKEQTERLVAKYDSETPPASIDKDEAIPTDVTLLFIVPENTQLKSLEYQSKKIADAVLEVK